MKNYLIIGLLFFICMARAFAQEDKNERKLKAAIDKEEQKFLKKKENNPDDPGIYWDHANKVAEFNSEYKRALNFYQKAVDLDSVNGAIYRDYGKYLFDRMFALDEAQIILTKGLHYSGNDDEIKKYLVSVNTSIAKRDEELKLRDIGKTDAAELNPDGNYASMVNFDSLKMVITDAGNNKSYIKLLNRFLENDKHLTPEEMYILIIGYSRDKYYNPFNYNDINTMKQLVAYSLDSAISKGLEIINTNPLNPSLNRELMYCYRKKNDPVSAENYLIRVKQFYSGMLYSGNGTCERPYIILWSKEDNNFINYLGYKSTNTHSMGTCASQMAEIADMIDPVSGKTRKICFNLQLIYQQTTGR